MHHRPCAAPLPGSVLHPVRTIRVITVDDHAVFREAVRALVARTPGFELVGESENGEAALRLVPHKKPDLMLVDVRMPGLDGFELSKRLHDRGHAPVIVLASSADLSRLEPRARDCGAAALIGKQGLTPRLLRELWEAHRPHPVGVMRSGPPHGQDGGSGSGQEERMTDEFEEMGPIDYIVIEWTDKQPTGEAVPLILDAVDRGIIRVLDIAFMSKDEAGNVVAIDLGGDDGAPEGWDDFAGASSGIIGSDEIYEAAVALEAGTSAALLVWENRWAGPIGAALRRSGGQLVASGRIPVQDILAKLDALEAVEAAS
jgi:CheY-like chemotaxis protein